MRQEMPELGKLIEGEAFRDAIHVAVAPVTAGCDMTPGTHVGFDEKGEMICWRVEMIGIVDPFLTSTVKKGERFWLFLYPNTVTSIRHVWTHKAFTPKVPERKGDRE